MYESWRREEEGREERRWEEEGEIDRREGLMFKGWRGRRKVRELERRKES